MSNTADPQNIASPRDVPTHDVPTRDVPIYDVVVIGGGPAGLSAAVALARSLRSVLVIDAGEPRNAPSHAAHNVLGREGIAPAELLDRGRDEARSYDAEVAAGRVTEVAGASGAIGDSGDARRDFTLTLDSGRRVRARRVLLAAGVRDELPEIPGLARCWGVSVLHCPYCHGYEVRGQRIGVLGLGPNSVHQALLFSQLSDQVTYFPQAEPCDGEQRAQLAAAGVAVIDGNVARVLSDGDQVRGVELSPGGAIPLDAIVVMPRTVVDDGLCAQLGLEVEMTPMGPRVPVEQGGATAVPGVFAAGNIADPAATVAAAASSGMYAGAMINAGLIHEDIARRRAAV